MRVAMVGEAPGFDVSGPVAVLTGTLDEIRLVGAHLYSEVVLSSAGATARAPAVAPSPSLQTATEGSAVSGKSDGGGSALVRAIVQHLRDVADSAASVGRSAPWATYAADEIEDHFGGRAARGAVQA